MRLLQTQSAGQNRLVGFCSAMKISSPACTIPASHRMITLACPFHATSGLVCARPVAGLHMLSYMRAVCTCFPRALHCTCDSALKTYAVSRLQKQTSRKRGRKPGGCSAPASRLQKQASRSVACTIQKPYHASEICKSLAKGCFRQHGKRNQGAMSDHGSKSIKQSFLVSSLMAAKGLIAWMIVVGNSKCFWWSQSCFYLFQVSHLWSPFSSAARSMETNTRFSCNIMSACCTSSAVFKF